MIEQYSVAQLIFTAVFFFLTAVILLLVSLRLAGYLGGVTEEEPDSPMQQLYDWLAANVDNLNTTVEMYQLGNDRRIEVHLVVDRERRVVFVFDDNDYLDGVVITDYDDYLLAIHAK